jgi:hydroxyacylglutathione hydrolase
MNITPLPLLQDNYAWLLWSSDSRDCAVVDPSECRSVMQAIDARGLRLRSILVTHHHGDHVGGVAELVAIVSQAKSSVVEVYCSAYDAHAERVPCVTHPLEDGQHVSILGHDLECLSVPGHTLGAVAFYMKSLGAVFTGDTLFLAGCGRLFEGTPEQMFASLQRLASLPATTSVYCGHEYTEKNLRFAARDDVDGKNKSVRARLLAVEALRTNQLPTVPARLVDELATNPFIRCKNAVEFARLRTLRDVW